MATPEQERRAAVAAVRNAMAVCRKVAASLGDADRLVKSDASPVTVADFASQAVVIHTLQAELGPMRLVAEESAAALREPQHAAVRDAVVEATAVGWSGATSDAVLEAIDAGDVREPGPVYWTLDPIDGTKGFLRGEQYAVSLAKVVDGRPVLGVLGCPNLGATIDHPPDVADSEGTVFAAHGSTTELDGHGRLSVASEAERPDPIVVTHSVESGHTKLDHLRRILDHLGWAWQSLPADSQAKYAMVARGQAHIYMRIPTKPDRIEPVWDHAAGVAVAQGAGVRVTDLRGAALDFSQGPGLRANFGVVCAHPNLHPDLVRAAKDLGLPPPVGSV